MSDLKADLVGIEWADEIDSDIKSHISNIPLIEIIPDNFFYPTPEQDQTLNLLNDTNTPVMIHSVNLSLLSLDPFKEEYFHRVMSVSKRVSNVFSFSDHLCFTEIAGNQVGQLTSAPYCRETLVAASSKINKIQDITKQNFVIENISHPFFIPTQEMSEVDFLKELIRNTDCRILLDLNNLYTNQVNFNVDSHSYIDQLPINRIDSIHLAGGFVDEDNILQDGHSECVPEQVWNLYRYLINKSKKSIPTIIERTGNNSEGIGPIFADQQKAQMILKEILGGQDERS